MAGQNFEEEGEGRKSRTGTAGDLPNILSGSPSSLGLKAAGFLSRVAYMAFILVSSWSVLFSQPWQLQLLAQKKKKKKRGQI